MACKLDKIEFNNNTSPGAQYEVSISDREKLSLIWSPPGSFLMGNENADETIDKSGLPRHKVILSEGFWIGSTPITCGQWDSIMKSNSNQNSRAVDFPISWATWNDAIEFCDKLSKVLQKDNILLNTNIVTLPTEAQWEYACRAMSITPWFFGNDSTLLHKYAWFASNSGGKINPVRTKLPNSWGLYDMYGNVSEWCLDSIYLYGNTLSFDPINLDLNKKLKVVRGGDCTDINSTCRSSCRTFVLAGNTHGEDVGFRIVVNSSDKMVYREKGTPSSSSKAGDK